MSHSLRAGRVARPCRLPERRVGEGHIGDEGVGVGGVVVDGGGGVFQDGVGLGQLVVLDYHEVAVVDADEGFGVGGEGTHLGEEVG